MRNRTLLVVLALLLCLTVAGAAMAASAKPAAKPAKAAAKPAVAKAFNQQAELDKFWKSPDSAVVATVNGNPVTKGELMRALWYWNAPTTLNDLINQKMIEQAAKKSKVSLTPAEQKAKEEESIKRMGVPDLKSLLNQFKITKDRFTSGIKISALAEKCVQQQVKVTDADYAGYVKARHILIRFPDDEKDQAKKEEIAKKKIDEIAAKVKAGEDFAKLADEYSEDPGNMRDGKKQGGDLGWFSKGRMVQEFEQAAFALKPGQVSEPVKTFYGYHLIKVEAIGKDASPAEKATLKQQILSQSIPMEMQRWFGDLQAKTKIDNKLAEPPVKEPKPAMMPRPSTRPTVTPVTPRPAASQPAVKTAPATSEKPDMPPPPPPPAP